jgi:chromosomal replication initiation ATPase DnaA
MKDIAQQVAAAHGFTVEQLRSKGRTRKLAWARQDAAAAIYATGKYSTTQVGNFFNVHHTTVLFSIRQAEARSAA